MATDSQLLPIRFTPGRCHRAPGFTVPDDRRLNKNRTMNGVLPLELDRSGLDRAHHRAIGLCASEQKRRKKIALSPLSSLPGSRRSYNNPLNPTEGGARLSRLLLD